MDDKEKRYQKQLHKIVIGKGLSGKSTPKKGEHDQYKIDKKNSAAARKKLKQEAHAHMKKHGG